MRKLFPILLFLSLIAKADNYTYIQGPTLIESSSTVVTAAATTSLSASSNTNYLFTGTTTQTVNLPSGTTLKNGRRFNLYNASTGAITFKDYANNLLLTIPGTSEAYAVLIDNSTSAGVWATTSVPTLNGLSSTAQTFATGTSGSDFAISSSGSVHTFNIPDAGSSARGLITTGTQTIAGTKTFSSTITGTTSGNTTYTANNHGVVLSGSGNAMTVVAPVTGSTKFLRNGGTSADPSMDTIAAGDLPTIALTGDVTGSASGGSIATTLASSISGAKTFSTSLTSPAFISSSSNPASAGVFRLADTDLIKWRNHANGADVSLGKNTSDQLTWAGTSVFSNAGVLLAAAFPALTGDITTSAGALGTTLATVNSNVGTFTNVTATVNAKGLVTAISSGSSGGSGDFSSNTSTSVDGEVVLFSGTAGKTGKRATGTGIAHLTSGVQTASAIVNADVDAAAAIAGSKISFTPPTVQTFTSGTDAIYSTPAGVLYLEIEQVGGGAGGNGGGNSGGTGGAGGDTIWKTSGGTAIATAGGGSAGSGSDSGAGGTATINSPAIEEIKVIGGRGNAGFQINNVTNLVGCGLPGASGPYGGAGRGGNQNSGSPSGGSDASAQSGSGGGGGAPNGGNTNTSYGGAGGSAGGFVRFILTSPSATYHYTCGSGGLAGATGSNGQAGGAGGGCKITVKEFYQ